MKTELTNTSPLSHPFLNRDVIKYIAIVTMTLNHIANALLPEGTFLYTLFTDIGYFTAITMCFFLVEGFHHTRSRKKYAMRLALFAMISQPAFSLAFKTKSLNMIFTLLICYAILYALKAVQNPVLRFIAAAALCGITLFSDWPLMAAFFTYFLSEAYEGRTSFTKAYTSCIFLFFLLEFAGQADGSPVFKALALTAAASLPLLISALTIRFLYTGHPAKHARVFHKWFFYIYYPAHLLVIALLRMHFHL